MEIEATSFVTTAYFYSGARVISEKQGSTWTDYIFFGKRRIAKQTGSTPSTATYLHRDHLGSTRVVSDSTGTSVGNCNYEPFGEFQPGSSCSSLPTNYRFAGMEFDEETQLYHTWFRSYDPNQGRWMSVDPLPGHPEDPQTLNRYAYVQNSPINFVDPFGLIPIECPEPKVVCGIDPDGQFVCRVLVTKRLPRPSDLPGIPLPDDLLAQILELLRLRDLAIQTALMNAALEIQDLAAHEISDRCARTLDSLGATQFELQLGAFLANFIDGRGSTIPMSRLYENSPNADLRRIARAGAIPGTVGSSLARAGVVAVAEAGGSNIYYNPNTLNPLDYQGILGTAFHEIMHNIVGLTDPDFQSALGLDQSQPSVNISRRLLADCFGRLP